MDWLDRHLAIFPEPELLLVVGAGQGRDLPVLTAHCQRRIVLLEPQSRWADELRQKTREQSAVEIMQCALDEASGQDTLKVFNFDELTSLRPAPDLQVLFPGARETTQLPVETLSLADLVVRCDIEADRNNWLIVDAPGTSTIVLAGLKDPDLARRFPHVVLRVRRSISGEVDLGSVQHELFVRGYSALGSADENHGDWFRVHFLRTDRLPLRRDLEQRIDGLEQDLKRLATQNQAFLQRLAEAETRAEAQQEEIRQRKAELRDLNWSHEAALAELKDQHSSRSQERDRRLEHLSGVIDRKNADLSLSLRLQEQRESDLNELQARYDALLDSRTSQHEVLSQIRERLTLAAKFLQELKSESDQDRKDELTRSLLRTLTQGEGEND